MKLLHWEPAYSRWIHSERVKELGQVASLNAMRAVNEGISFAAPCLVASATFIVRVVTGGVLTPTSIFTTVSLFALMQVRGKRKV